ncbi:DUF397 domain-containing protein [Streptomyces sp. NPDC000070]|uniref:DUF397 domain-containing protein n=1 Tax=Streptomyces sp. NPDC000070 TaxID=3154240 RepID=UPI00332E00D3
MRSTPEYDPDSVTWLKSSYSGGSGGDCLETAHAHAALVPVRDSKHPSGQVLLFTTPAWCAFLTHIAR